MEGALVQYTGQKTVLCNTSVISLVLGYGWLILDDFCWDYHYWEYPYHSGMVALGFPDIPDRQGRL